MIPLPRKKWMRNTRKSHKEKVARGRYYNCEPPDDCDTNYNGQSGNTAEASLPAQSKTTTESLVF
jgi:hypothetical protein